MPRFSEPKRHQLARQQHVSDPRKNTEERMGADFELVNSNLITGAVALLESMLLEIYQNISKLAL